MKYTRTDLKTRFAGFFVDATVLTDWFGNVSSYYVHNVSSAPRDGYIAVDSL
jgi:hypothetical protein